MRGDFQYVKNAHGKGPTSGSSSTYISSTFAVMPKHVPPRPMQTLAKIEIDPAKTISCSTVCVMILVNIILCILPRSEPWTGTLLQFLSGYRSSQARERRSSIYRMFHVDEYTHHLEFPMLISLRRRKAHVELLLNHCQNMMWMPKGIGYHKISLSLSIVTDPRYSWETTILANS